MARLLESRQNNLRYSLLASTRLFLCYLQCSHQPALKGNPQAQSYHLVLLQYHFEGLTAHKAQAHAAYLDKISIRFLIDLFKLPLLPLSKSLVTTKTKIADRSKHPIGGYGSAVAVEAR